MGDEASQPTIMQAELIDQMEAGWDDLIAYLETLTEKQHTEFTDAAGWTVKDHVMHMAVWEDNIIPILDKQPRHIHLGLDEALWNSHDVDKVNGVLQQRYRDQSWEAVMEAFKTIHARVMQKVATLSDDDVMRPYYDYQPWATYDGPVGRVIIESSNGHYAEHRPWIEAIATGE